MFLHEESAMCRYGKRCEINNCIFKHNSDTTEDVIDDLEIVDINDITEDENDDEVDNEEETEIEVSERTFVNPSQKQSKL